MLLNSVVGVAPTSASLPSVGVIPLHDDVVYLVGRRVIGECEKKRKDGGWEIEEKEKKNYLVTRHPDLPHCSPADEFQMLLGRDERLR